MGEKAPEDPPMRIFALPVNPLCPVTDNPPNQVQTYNLSNNILVK